LTTAVLMVKCVLMKEEGKTTSQIADYFGIMESQVRQLVSEYYFIFQKVV
jgi:DNA-directed RNA polymerase specialized sigma subunit